MSLKNQDEKISLYLENFGNTLKEQRTIILNKTVDEFVEFLNSFSNIVFTEDIINKMESSESVDIKYWITVWIYFQNIDKINIAYNAKEMMFLARQEMADDIEQQILNKQKE